MQYPYLGPCLLARGVARVPAAAVDVLLALEDFCNGGLHGAGFLKGEEVLPVAEYLGLPATLLIHEYSKSLPYNTLPSPINRWMKEISALCHELCTAQRNFLVNVPRDVNSLMQSKRLSDFVPVMSSYDLNGATRALHGLRLSSFSFGMRTITTNTLFHVIFTCGVATQVNG